MTHRPANVMRLGMRVVVGFPHLLLNSALESQPDERGDICSRDLIRRILGEKLLLRHMVNRFCEMSERHNRDK